MNTQKVEPERRRDWLPTIVTKSATEMKVIFVFTLQVNKSFLRPLGDVMGLRER